MTEVNPKPLLVEDLLVDRQLDRRFIMDYPYHYFIDEIRLSHSTLSTYTSCPRRFEFSKLYQNPKYNESLATRFGTAIHEGFQTYLLTKNYNRAMFQMMLKYPWDYGESPMKERSAEGAYKLLDEMIQRFPVDRYELAYISDAEGNQIPCIELPFKIRFPEFEFKLKPREGFESAPDKPIDVYYVGYMDLVLYDKEEDEYIVVDIKTTTSRSDDLVPQYKYSDQCVPYGIVLNQLLNIPIDSLKVGYYVAKPNLVDPLVSFIDFYKSSDDLSDWAKSLWRTLSDLQNNLARGWFPRNGNNCVAFGRPCSYFDLCHCRDSQRIQTELAYSGDREEQKPFDGLVEITTELGDLFK